MGKCVGKLLNSAGGQPLLIGGDDYPVSESDRLAFCQFEPQDFPTIAKDLLPQRIGGKQAISPGMPVSRITRIPRMIDHYNRQGIFLHFSIEHTPDAPSAPGAIPPLTRTGKIGS